MAHDAFHHLQAIEGSIEIDRWRVLPYFGTESGDLLASSFRPEAL
jgi:hypothetical protein